MLGVQVLGSFPGGDRANSVSLKRPELSSQGVKVGLLGVEGDGLVVVGDRDRVVASVERLNRLSVVPDGLIM